MPFLRLQALLVSLRSELMHTLLGLIGLIGTGQIGTDDNIGGYSSRHSANWQDPRLARCRRNRGPNRAHVRQFGLHRETSDNIISEFAKQNGYAIITADRDFLQLAELHGAPPQVIRLEAMDYPTHVAAMLIRKYALVIAEFGLSSRAILILRKDA